MALVPLPGSQPCLWVWEKELPLGFQSLSFEPIDCRLSLGGANSLVYAKASTLMCKTPIKCGDYNNNGPSKCLCIISFVG